MEPTIFNIPACNIEILEKKLKRLNKKGERAGTGAITLTRVSETVEKNTDGSVDVFYQVAIEGETPKIAGWAFLATLDHNSDPSGASNMVYVMPGQSCPDDYRVSAADCDHCGYRRTRRKTYVLRNEVSGDLKQVGHTCVQDFIGIDPAKVAALAERIVGLMKAAKEAEEGGTLGVPYDRRHIDLERFLGYVAMTCRKTGWVSGKEAFNDQMKRSSSSSALGDMFPVGGINPQWHDTPEAEDELKAKDALAYALTLDRSKSDYNHNVVTMATTGYIDWKATGIAASIIRIYDLNLARQAEQKAQVDLSGSEYMGTVKDRLRGEVTVIGKKHGEGRYGPWTMVRMVTKNQGNVLVTFATGANFNPEVGAEIEIKGTVKEHSEFNKVKQTMLNRVAFA